MLDPEFVDEITFIATEREEVVDSSFWDTPENAEAYSQTVYPEVLKALGNVVEGIPTVRTFNSVTATFNRTFAGTLS
jgi:hypothetical protein